MNAKVGMRNAKVRNGADAAFAPGLSREFQTLRKYDAGRKEPVWDSFRKNEAKYCCGRILAQG